MREICRDRERGREREKERERERESERKKWSRYYKIATRQFNVISRTQNTQNIQNLQRFVKKCTKNFYKIFTKIHETRAILIDTWNTKLYRFTQFRAILIDIWSEKRKNQPCYINRQRYHQPKNCIYLYILCIPDTWNINPIYKSYRICRNQDDISRGRVHFWNSEMYLLTALQNCFWR